MKRINAFDLNTASKMAIAAADKHDQQMAAMDHVINDMLRSFGVRSYDKYKGMSAEEIYRKLVENM